MRTPVFVALLLLLAACGESPVPETAPETPVPDPSSSTEAVFQQATDAVLALETVSYRFTLSGTMVMDDTVNYEAAGTAVLKKGFAGLEDASMNFEFTGTEGEEAFGGVIISDGIVTSFHDAVQNEYTLGDVEGGGAAIVLRDNMPAGALLREFLFTEEPFGAELNAGESVHHGSEDIGGIPCWKVTVNMPPYTSTWWMDQETMLPMANEISVWGPDGRGMEYRIELSEVVPDVEVTPDVFTMNIPEDAEPELVFGSLVQGTPAPLWTLDTPGGETVSLEELRGKVVVMDFWATWCGPCRAVMPVLQDLHETHGEDLAVIGINVWENADPEAFMAENGYTYTTVLDGDEVAMEYLVEGIPTFYVIAPDGTVAFHAVGADPANEEALREIVGTLLQ